MRALRSIIIVSAAFATLGASTGGAVCVGDCNRNGDVTVDELLIMVNIALGNAPVTDCEAGDENGDGMITIEEILKAVNAALSGCPPTPTPTITNRATATDTPTGTPTQTLTTSPTTSATLTSTETATGTHTPAPQTPTNTPTETSTAAKTATPNATDTPTSTSSTTLTTSPTASPTLTPTQTGTATSAPIPTGSEAATDTPTGTPTTSHTGSPTGTPTDTPTASTPNTPTSTSTPTQTPTTTQGGIGQHSFNLVSGRPLCRGMCVGGPVPGRRCQFDAGASGCGGGTCQDKICYGGANPGMSCSNDFQCGAIDGCRQSPLTGSCAIVQGKIVTPRLPLLGSLLLDIGAPDGSGVATVTIPAALTRLDAQQVTGIGFACVTQGANATGIIDCNGGSDNIDQLLEIDHNTGTSDVCMRGSNAGGACTMQSECPGVSQTAACNLFNSGPANGLPDDPSCTAMLALPDGTASVACPEGERVCVSGVNQGIPCLGDPDCPGSTCSATQCGDGPNVGMACTQDSDCPQSRCASFICRGGTNNGNFCTLDTDCPSGVCIPCSSNDAATSHTGVCNSPLKFTQSGTFGPGALLVAVPLAIQLLDIDGSQNGPDALPCTSDDTPDSPPAPVTVVLGTGKATIKVYDANNENNNQIAPGAMCSGLPCAVELTGSAFNCTTLATSVTAGGRIVGGFPALDTLAGDIATTFQFESQ